MREVSPSGSAYKLNFVQCASCGAVVGVLDWYNIGSMLEKQNKAIKAIAAQMNISVNLD